MSPTVQYIAHTLAKVYPPDEARAIALWLVEELTGKSRTDLLLSHEPIEIHDLDKCLSRLADGEPVQYLLGRTDWMGLNLRLTRDTLIPRPETGELVNWIIEDGTLQDKPVRVVDIGTGSGCIAVALKKRFPQWDIHAWDISSAALDIAHENALRNGTEISFAQVDITSYEKTIPLSRHPFDIVVSNPPYVMEKEKDTMEANVLQYEPAQALFVPNDDPLLFYRAIARKHLAPVIYFEINGLMGQAVADLMRQEGYADVTIRKDCYGKERMVKAIDNG